MVFIRNIMDNVNYQDAYDKLVERIDKSLRFVTRIQDGLKKDVEKKKDSSLQMSDIFACDAFAGLDDIIIDWALEQLNDEILDAQIDGLNIAQIADQRMSKAYHYSERYKNEYTTIKYAYLMMKSVSLMEFSSDIKTLVANYQKESYLIDSYYRWFYYAYDQIEDNSKFSDVRQRVENIYANTYLQKITPKWNENFTNEVMNATDLPKQEDFYKHYLRGYDGKQRVIVIISDAFRYECAKELFSRLELDEKCTPKMECMLSCLPSVTSVGMASLLPHNEMQVDGNLNVTVDGQACASMEQRDKILKSYNENNVALSFDEVANANQARIRELIQGKNIVYIYHNQVDARGDKPASENEVFNACAEAIEEIHKLVKKLTGYVSAPKFFITADHGFLYKRDRLQEFDKVTYPKDKCLYTNKRFLITEDAVNEQGIMARTMAYLNKLYVDTPVGADIFKVAGGGQNYVQTVVSLPSGELRETENQVFEILDEADSRGGQQMYDNVIRYAVPLGKHIHLFLFIDYRKLSVSKFGSLILLYSKKLYFPYTANSISKPSGIFFAFCNKLVHDSFSLLCKMFHNNRFYRNKKKYHECHSVI